jgi:hypothetical protein
LQLRRSSGDMIRADGFPRERSVMTRKVLRALELALLAVIGAAEWAIDWTERQSKAIILGLGMLLGVAATMIVAAIYASLR